MTAGPTGYHMTRPSEHVQVRTRDDGSLDEIVAKHATVHLERMADDHYWLAIYTTSGERLVVNLRSELEILAHWAPNL